ncbi:MAG: HNH endonuclease [candidate division Zixibacteria bacterium]|nr:HNH endonuclease [candidate division Zixibacteria bacterium]
MLHRNVLVLNQNYEPLSVCTVKRAIVLVYLGKAEIIEKHDGYMIHSVSLRFPVPSVVRLGFYIKVPNKRILLTRKNIIKRDGHRCQYCGENHGAMTVDHVIPKIYGVQDSWENLVCACLKCNNIKGDQTPEQAGFKLLRRPKRPNHITFIQQFIGISDQRWKQYLFLD